NWSIRVSFSFWCCLALLEWLLKYFNIYIKEHTVGVYRLLILDSHKSHNLLEFTKYCKENKIVTLYILLYSLHIL
ncbi:hypothetical protein K469DRAFT_585817, partial [Zopfia rhizophila CBS 207.26]